MSFGRQVQDMTIIANYDGVFSYKYVSNLSAINLTLPEVNSFVKKNLHFF
jgi:hypothetical protein